MIVGMAPHTTAQGVKMDPMYRPLAASAVMKGHGVGSGHCIRWSGSASVRYVTSTSRSVLESPVTTGCVARSASQRGFRLDTVGSGEKL